MTTARKRNPKPKPEKQAKKVRLDHAFAGLKAGEMMYVATPAIVEAYIRAIPRGETRTIIAMRRELARREGCDGSCPVSTSFFVRAAAEGALAALEAGASPSEVTPFWRLISSGDAIAKRLPTDPEWIDTQRQLEKDQ